TAHVKATASRRLSAGLDTRTGRASLRCVGSEEIWLLSHQGDALLFWPFPLSRLNFMQNGSVKIEQGHHLERIVAGNELAVSGELGSQAITHNGTAPCSPGVPLDRELPASNPAAMRTAHRLRSAHDCFTTGASSRCPHFGRLCAARWRGASAAPVHHWPDGHGQVDVASQSDHAGPPRRARLRVTRPTRGSC